MSRPDPRGSFERATGYRGRPAVALWALVVCLGGSCWGVLDASCCWVSQTTTAQNQAYELSKSIDCFVEEQRRLPESLMDLTEGPRPMLQRVPLDPWGAPYRLVVPGLRNERFDIISAGPDRAFYTADDLGNWP